MTLPCLNLKCRDKLVCDTSSILKCEEKGKKYILINNNNNYKLGKLRYDGGYCAGDSNVGKVVDFIIFTCKSAQTVNKNDEKRIAIVIELKGTDVSRAYAQLQDTLKRESNGLLSDYIVFARLIPKRVPSAILNASTRSSLLKVLSSMKQNKNKVKNSKMLFREIGGCRCEENIESLYCSV